GSLAVSVGTGVVASVANLLILGGVIASGESAPSRGVQLLWAAGFLVTGGLVAGLGGVLGGGGEPGPNRTAGAWVSPFAWTAAVATFLLLVIGGVVTSEEAGLAVPDWPNSFGSNMFLYPISRMIAQNDVYFEHTHRLFGSLVGLVVLTFTVFSWASSGRRWFSMAVTLALLMVVFQGVLGGMRVEQADLWQGEVSGWKRSMKDAFDALGLDATRLRVFHGVFGQVFFAWLLAIAAFASSTWRDRPLHHRLGAVDRWMTAGFVICLLIQLVLGALTRHVSRESFIFAHLGFAFAVAGYGLFVALRRLVTARDVDALRRLAAILGFAMLGQIALGFGAYALTSGEETTMATLVATSHQGCGAIILGLAAFDASLVFRLTAARNSPSKALSTAIPD
ncbi:MAG: COX15/CtaA family protein, partial [Planctomycetes bacterium]|nr:COX15/CtaA family protein [Planctomycetota bacterium]